MKNITLLPFFQRLFCLIFLLSITYSISAQKVSLQGAEIPSFSQALANQFSEYQTFQVNTQALATQNTSDENFQIRLQLGDTYDWNINLTPSQIISPNYREILGTENGPVVLPRRKNIAFTGYLPGTDLESRLTLDDGWIMGFVTTPDGNKIYIEPLGNLQPNANNNHYIIYTGNAVLNNDAGSCGSQLASSRAPMPPSSPADNSTDPGSEPVTLNNLNCKEVDFSVASAFDMINSNHDTPELVMNHIISITNMMQTYFEFVPIQYLLNDNYVSGSPAADPFGETVETNTDVLLPGFVDWAQNAGILAEHDVAQVWTARNIEGCGIGSGLVGCAYINVICNNLRYNICEDYVPNDIKTLSVLSAHELGHNWNCLHPDKGDAPFNIMNGNIQPDAIGFGPNSMAKIMNTAEDSECLSGCGIVPPTPNCTAQAEFPFQEWIEDVTVGTLMNLGSGKFRDYSTAGYSDYTDLDPPILALGQPVSYTFTIGNSGVNPGDYWTAFIDYNQNNIFDLPEELVVQNQGQSIGGEFIVPDNIPAGITTMRIILSKDGFSGPCDNPAFGEVEDYLIEITGTPPPPDLADLTIGNLVVDNQAFLDETVPYFIDISNIGLTTTGDFSLGVFLSMDNQFDNNDLLIGEIPTGNFDPGITISNVNGAFDLSGIDPGDYFLFFKVDKDEVITESDESNNTIRRDFTVNGFPDNLIDLELSLSASVNDPDQFSNSRVTLTLTNNSANQATNIVSFFNFSPDDYVIAGNGAISITGGGSFSHVSGIWSIPSLSAGGTATVSFDLFTLSDNFNPCAEVVSAGEPDIDSTPNNGQCPNAVEDDEANLFTIPPPELTVDYVFESLDFPSSGVYGTSSLGDINYARLGTSMELLTVTVEVYLSEDSQLDSEDHRIGLFNLTSNTTASNNTVSISYNLIGIDPGDYTLITIFDRANEISELNENNNIGTTSFTVESEEVPDCSSTLSGDEILCSQNIGDLTRLYIRQGDEYYTTDIDLDANVVATSSPTPFVYDSTLVQDGVLTHKLADGTITYSNNLPSAVLEFIPDPVAATLLTTGEYLIAGTVPLGEVGEEPYGVQTRVLKLDATGTTIIQQKSIVENGQFPANLLDEVFALYPLNDGQASILYTIRNQTLINNSNIQVRVLDNELNLSGDTFYPRTGLISITETPCGELKLKLKLLQVAQKGSTVADQITRISKDGSITTDFWEQGIVRADRAIPRQFTLFTREETPSFSLSYFSDINDPPNKLIANLPQPNGDTTQVELPFFEYNYATRNGNAVFLYGDINNQITLVNECEIEPPADGVDIAVNLSVSDSMPGVFSKIFYQVTVVNEGTETATGLSIDFDYGAQEDPKPLALVNNPNPNYNAWQGIWTIGTLAPGEARTFELEVFVLPDAGPSTTLFAELRTLDQEDIDPTNDLSLSTIFIESGATLNDAAVASVTNLQKGPRLSINNIFPNPTTTEITIAINSKVEQLNVPLEIFNAFGKQIYIEKINLEEGTNLVRIPVQSFAEGVYLVVLPTGSHQNLVKRFVKIKE